MWNIINKLKEENTGAQKGLIFMTIVSSVSEILLIVVINAVLLDGTSKERFFYIFLILLLLYIFSTNYSERMIIVHAERMTTDIRERIVESVRNAELESYEEIGEYALIDCISSDTEYIAEIIPILWGILRDSVVIVGGLTYLFFLSPVASLLMALAIFCGILAYVQQQKEIKQQFLNAREKGTLLFEFFDQLIYGFKELRINDEKSDDFFHTRLKPLAGEMRDAMIDVENRFINTDIAMMVIWNLLIFLMVFILPVTEYVASDMAIMSVNVILFLPIFHVIGPLPSISQADMAFKRIIMLEEQLEELDIEEVVSDRRKHDFRKIGYSKIRFHYYDEEGDKEFSIGPINMSINRGEILFVTGGNGSGKSTLLKVITGLYHPASGRVEMDGSKIAMAEHRYLFSAIFTDFHLFDRLYGMRDVGDAQVSNLIEQMKLQEKVTCSSGKFDTLDLSTGQRKRLALIVARLEDRPIYVFDEWAAGQDPEFREYFYMELLPQFKRQGKTIIAVTHDDHYFHAADRVLKMEYGAING